MEESLLFGDDVCWIPFDYMEKFIFDVFVALGVPEHEARVCADVLITADKRGIDSHGIGRLKHIYYDRIRAGTQNPVTNFEVVRDREAIAVVDGHNGMGHYIARKSMQMAIDKARHYGIGMVAVRNSTHYGIAGYYVLMATDQNMIGITGTNARPSVAPTFGVENMLGTNPLTFGIPTDEEFPFVIDCATSVTQRGKIEVYGRAGKPIPEGWIIDDRGKTRTDTEQILKDLTTGKAATLPLGGLGETTGGHKGYGYATAVELLCAALQNGKFMKELTDYDEKGNRRPIELGHFFIAINIEFFIDVNEFKRIAGVILRLLRGSKKMPGQDRIYTAGEKEYLAYKERLKRGGVPVPKTLQKNMIIMRDELGLNYKFPFEEGQASAK